ncbi:MAG: M43 family zinc metalloprotease, partial [Chitinophagaceae bacterium]
TTFEALQDFRSKTPGAATDAQFELKMKAAIQARVKQGAILSNYTIPVIFHILHEGEAIGTGQNLSAAQIQAQLAQLSADFANASGSMYGVAANANIQFALAVIDPQGHRLAEPGIERINLAARSWLAPPYDVMTYNNFVDATILPNTIWNPYAYMNVWITELDDNVLGRATLPSLSGLNDLANMGESDNQAGVLLDYRSVGSKSSPGAHNYWGGQGRTLTHEAGHFFGLRHIWGDEDCGNDYCGDTPTQFEATSGCPGTTTLTGCTPGENRMYENYMDYSYDNCVNTFTADQVARMQAVMLNSPRRKELAASGTHIAPANNLVRFENVSFSFSENGVNTSACPAYREVTVNLNLFDAATDVATLQFIANGTAQAGVDYELVTPTLTFNPGDASKTLVLRIFDDALVESTENIVLQYSITGTGIQAADENQTLTIEISDNDADMPIDQHKPVILFYEDFGADGGGLLNNWQQILWGAQDEINLWTISNNGGAGFTGRVAHISNDGFANTYDQNSRSDVILLTRQIDAKGFSNVSLSFKYKCEGEAYGSDEIYDFGTLMYSLDGEVFQVLPNIANNNQPFLFHSTSSVVEFNQNIGSILDNKSFYLGFRWKNDYSDGLAPGFTIDDVMIRADALKVGETVGEIGKQTVFAGQTILLKNTSSTELIAKIENASSDLGCVTATITQAGTALQPIITDAGTYQRTGKVVQVSPQHQTAATVTLYFTDAELAQWQTVKGELKVLKVADNVSLSGVLTARNAEIITPTVTDYPTEGYTAYTFTVSSFSQFMLVSPTFTLPVKLVQFEAKAAGRQINISWQTADERENKGFWLERSTNGIQYERQAWVPAASSYNYTYTDRFVQPGVVFYYRLQQVDVNGKTTYSGIRQAQVAGTGIGLQVTPNPTSGQVKVFVSGQLEPFSVRLLNAAGGLVGQWQGVTALAPFSLQMAHLPKGIYTVLVFTADGIRSQKIIKQ